MACTKSARGTLAVDEQAPALAGNLVLFLLAGIVRDIAKQT